MKPKPYNLGVSSFIIKPATFEPLLDVVRGAVEVLVRRCRAPAPSDRKIV